MRYTSILVIAFLVASCLAQAPRSSTRVSGRVINQTGQPLTKATVALVGNNRGPGSSLSPAYTTTSNADGVFMFEAVEPNTYRLFAQRAGFMEFVFTNPNGTVVLPVAEGDQKTVEVKMVPQSFLSGKVTDEDGEPFPGATITAYRVSQSGGKRQLQGLPAVSAGRDGSFSVPNLIAGRYYLAATTPTSLTHTNQRDVDKGSGVERYVNTYFPSAIDTSSAILIDVASGTEPHGMDIRLQRARVFHIFGKVVNPAGSPVSNVTVNVLYPGVSDPLGNAHRVLIDNGVFQINELLPGDYVLQATTSARELQGRLRVSLSDRDADNAIVALAPGADIPVTVRIEGADSQQEETIRKSLGRFTLTSSSLGNDNAMAQAKDDGWIFKNIGAGTYRMGLGGPDGTYIKSIRYGNLDITHSELDTTAGGVAPLEMVLSAHAADISGTVLDANGNPLGSAIVSLWTPGLPPPGTIDRSTTTRTDAMGQFKFGRLAPGEYRIATWEKIDAAIVNPNLPEFHVQFDASATVVKLNEDAHEKVQPVLISTKQIEAAAAKLP